MAEDPKRPDQDAPEDINPVEAVRAYLQQHPGTTWSEIEEDPIFTDFPEHRDSLRDLFWGHVQSSPDFKDLPNEARKQIMYEIYGRKHHDLSTYVAEGMAAAGLGLGGMTAAVGDAIKAVGGLFEPVSAAADALSAAGAPDTSGFLSEVMQAPRRVQAVGQGIRDVGASVHAGNKGYLQEEMAREEASPKTIGDEVWSAAAEAAGGIGALIGASTVAASVLPGSLKKTAPFLVGAAMAYDPEKQFMPKNLSVEAIRDSNLANTALGAAGIGAWETGSHIARGRSLPFRLLAGAVTGLSAYIGNSAAMGHEVTLKDSAKSMIEGMLFFTVGSRKFKVSDEGVSFATAVGEAVGDLGRKGNKIIERYNKKGRLSGRDAYDLVNIISKKVDKMSEAEVDNVVGKLNGYITSIAGSDAEASRLTELLKEGMPIDAAIKRVKQERRDAEKLGVSEGKVPVTEQTQPETQKEAAGGEKTTETPTEPPVVEKPPETPGTEPTGVVEPRPLVEKPAPGKKPRVEKPRPPKEEKPPIEEKPVAGEEAPAQEPVELQKPRPKFTRDETAEKIAIATEGEEGGATRVITDGIHTVVGIKTKRGMVDFGVRGEDDADGIPPFEQMVAKKKHVHAEKIANADLELSDADIIRVDSAHEIRIVKPKSGDVRLVGIQKVGDKKISSAVIVGSGSAEGIPSGEWRVPADIFYKFHYIAGEPNKIKVGWDAADGRLYLMDADGKAYVSIPGSKNKVSAVVERLISGKAPDERVTVAVPKADIVKAVAGEKEISIGVMADGSVNVYRGAGEGAELIKTLAGKKIDAELSNSTNYLAGRDETVTLSAGELKRVAGWVKSDTLIIENGQYGKGKRYIRLAGEKAERAKAEMRLRSEIPDDADKKTPPRVGKKRQKTAEDEETSGTSPDINEAESIHEVPPYRERLKKALTKEEKKLISDVFELTNKGIDIPTKMYVDFLKAITKVFRAETDSASQVWGPELLDVMERLGVDIRAVDEIDGSKLILGVSTIKGRLLEKFAGSIRIARVLGQIPGLMRHTLAHEFGHIIHGRKQSGTDFAEAILGVPEKLLDYSFVNLENLKEKFNVPRDVAERVISRAEKAREFVWKNLKERHGIPDEIDIVKLTESLQAKLGKMMDELQSMHPSDRAGYIKEKLDPALKKYHELEKIIGEAHREITKAMDEIASQEGVTALSDIVGEAKALAETVNKPAKAPGDVVALEKYADAFAALLTDIKRAEKQAPNFYKAVEATLQGTEGGDKVLALFDALKQPKGERAERILDRMIEHYREGATEDAKHMDESLGEWRVAMQKASIKKALLRGFVEKETPILDMFKRYVSEEGTSRKGEVDAAWEAYKRFQRANDQISYYQREMAEVVNSLERKGVTIEEFGAYLELARELYDPKSKTVINPRFAAESDAKLALDALKKRLGEDKWNAVIEAQEQFKNVRSWLLDVLEETGAYNTKLIAYARENPFYAKFTHLDRYFQGKRGIKYSDAILRQLYGRKGSGGYIKNPFTETIKQDFALIRSALRSDAVMRVAEIGKELGEVSGCMWDKGHDGVWRPRAARKGYQNVAYLKQGKVFSVQMPEEFAKAFLGDIATQDINYQHALKTVVKAHNLWRSMYVTKNIGFMGVNLFRDYRRASRNLHALEGVGIADTYFNRKTWGEAVQRHFDVRPLPDDSPVMGALKAVTRKYFKIDPTTGRTPEIVREMESKSLLLSTVDQFNRFFDDADIHKDYLRMYEDVKQPGAVGKAKRMLVTLERIANLSETITKVAAYKKYMKLYEEGRTRRDLYEINKYVREALGSPNFRSRGSWHVAYNNISLFLNSRIQGWAWDIRVMRDMMRTSTLDTKMSYFFNMMTWDVMPRAIFAFAAQGLLGDKLKKIFGNIGLYHRMFEIPIPLPFGDPKDGTASLRWRTDEAGQLIGALAYMAFDTLARALSKSASLDLGQQKVRLADAVWQLLKPNPEPITSALSDLGGAVLFDKNPESRWGGPGIPADAWKAGGATRFKYLMMYMWNTYGWDVVRWNLYGYEKQQSLLRKVSEMPFIHRFLMVSNRGEYEEMMYEAAKLSKMTSDRDYKLNGKIKDFINKTPGSFSRAMSRQLWEDLGGKEGTGKTEYNFWRRYAIISSTHGNLTVAQFLLRTSDNKKRAYVLSYIIGRKVSEKEASIIMKHPEILAEMTVYDTSELTKAKIQAAVTKEFVNSRRVKKKRGRSSRRGGR